MRLYIIRESSPQFENRIMARVYVRSITRSIMYQKAPVCLPELAYGKYKSAACDFSSIKLDYSDSLKSSISRIKDVYAFSIKYR